MSLSRFKMLLFRFKSVTFPIQNVTFPIQNVTFPIQMLLSRIKMLLSRFKMLLSRFKMLLSRFKMLRSSFEDTSSLNFLFLISSSLLHKSLTTIIKHFNLIIHKFCRTRIHKIFSPWVHIWFKTASDYTIFSKKWNIGRLYSDCCTWYPLHLYLDCCAWYP